VLTVSGLLLASARLGFLFPADHVRREENGWHRSHVVIRRQLYIRVLGATPQPSRARHRPRRHNIARGRCYMRQGSASSIARELGKPSHGGRPLEEVARLCEEYGRGSRHPMEQDGACVVNLFFAAMPTLALTSDRYSSCRQTVARTMAKAASAAPMEQA
jgi:hypothetical protein